MTTEPSQTDTKVERDHPQTRKGESDARGSAMWNDDVVQPDDERTGDDRPQSARAARPQGGEPRRAGDSDTRKISEMAGDAEAVRKEAVGARTGGEALGSSVGGDVGSGTEPDRGELGGGEPMAEEGTGSPSGTRSPGGESRG